MNFKKIVEASFTELKYVKPEKFDHIWIYPLSLSLLQCL